jgi:hypothetical protein
MKRRDFLSGLGAVSAATATTALVAADLPNPPRTIDTDVLVIGGGTAGTIAAIQAGRLGARTILVEPGSQLGGTTTTGGVDFPGLFHAWGNQVIAGIGWELVTATAEMNDDDLPDFTKPTGRSHPRHQVRINGQLYAALAEEAAVKAGVQLRYYEFPLSVIPTPTGWRVRLVGKGTNVDVTAKQLVDCTGSASVVGLAGLPRLREKTTQPGTLIYRLGGWDPAAVQTSALEARAKAAIASGELNSLDIRGNITGFLRNRADNAMHVSGADSSTSETHASANILGRQSVLRVVRFLKKDPVFAFLKIERLQPETGVRETYRIVGETTVTEADYREGRVFADAVSHSFYPIDLHVDGRIVPDHLKEGIVPTVPRSALIPKGSKNLMVAGRCISSDRMANSALRVQASCMGMGQAAGVTAALAARSGTTPLQVPLADIRRELARHGAIVPKTA